MKIRTEETVKSKGRLREFELVYALKKAVDGRYPTEKTNDLMLWASEELESLLLNHAKNPQRKRFVARTTADYNYNIAEDDESQEQIFKDLNDALDRNHQQIGDSQGH